MTEKELREKDLIENEVVVWWEFFVRIWIYPTLYLLRVFKKLRNRQGRLYLGIIYIDMVFVPYAYDIFVKKNDAYTNSYILY